MPVHTLPEDHVDLDGRPGCGSSISSRSRSISGSPSLRLLRAMKTMADDGDELARRLESFRNYLLLLARVQLEAGCGASSTRKTSCSRP